jgi:DNA-binding transcriptional LysR family regulator
MRSGRFWFGTDGRISEKPRTMTTALGWCSSGHASMAEIRRQAPNVRFKFINLTTDEAVKRLADGMIDFALVRRDAVARPLQATPLGVMGYSLFLPKGLAPKPPAKSDLAILDGLPLATLEGEGNFRAALGNAARKAGIALNIQLECSSFPLAARAVVHGGMAAILPTIAAVDLQGIAVSHVHLPFLKEFDRDVCLALNLRLERVRPALREVTPILARAGNFQNRPSPRGKPGYKLSEH